MHSYNKWQIKVSAPRVNRVKQLRKAGLTWREIGKLLGVSRQRVQQLAAKGIK